MVQMERLGHKGRKVSQVNQVLLEKDLLDLDRGCLLAQEVLCQVMDLYLALLFLIIREHCRSF